MPSALTAELRCSSGTVSFSSTLSAPLNSASSRSRSASESRRVRLLVAGIVRYLLVRAHAVDRHAATGGGDLASSVPGESAGRGGAGGVHRGSAVGVEGLDRLQPPGLTLGPLRLRPGDDLPVGGEDQARAGVADLDAVAARLVDVQEKGLLDGVLVRAGLDEDAVLQADVGGAQDLLTRVDGVGDVVQASARAHAVLGVDQVVALVGEGEPDPGHGAVVHDDLLGRARAQALDEEVAGGLGPGRQQVQVVEP